MSTETLVQVLAVLIKAAICIGFPLTIVPRQRQALILDSGTFWLAKRALEGAEQAFIRWYKARALEVIPARVKIYGERYGFEYQKVRISSARVKG